MTRTALPMILALLAACTSSSTPPSTWQAMAFPGEMAESVGSLSMTSSGLVAGGMLGTDQDPAIWGFDGASWRTLSVDSFTVGVVSAILPDGADHAYLGWYDGLTGNVYGYRPSTGHMDTLALPALDVQSLAMKGGVLHAAGNEAAGPLGIFHGQVWRYEAGSWTSLGLGGNGTSEAGKPRLNGGLQGMAVSGSDLIVWGRRLEPDVDPDFRLAILVHRNGAWTEIAAPRAFKIWSMVSDVSGNLYAGGTSSGLAGQVWQYANGAWTAMGPEGAEQVLTLAVNSEGVIHAGGTDTRNGYMGQVWRLAGGKWTALGTTGCAQVSFLAAGPNGVMYAAGRDPVSALQVWRYTP